MVQQQDKLLVKLEELDARYAQIEKQISDPEISGNPARLIPLSKEQGKLRPLILRYRKFKELGAQIQDAETMLADADTEEEFRQLAEEEIAQLTEQKSALMEEIKDTLVMADDAAIDSIIIEIRPVRRGGGGTVCRDLYNMYAKYAERRHWKVEVLSSVRRRWAVFVRPSLMSRAGVWAELGYEGGGHRVQRVPETESQGRIHTSAATVAVLPEPEEVDVQIDPNDVVEHVSRAGGPGGQSVNKLNSAIKLEHLPTGITVNMREEKSQHKNRAKAWRILRTRVYEYYQSRIDKDRGDKRRTMIGSGDRSQRIRTYNFPQNRLTDHRINLSLYSLDRIIQGEMDELIAALQDYDKQQRLQNL